MLKYREPLKVDSADESSLILPRELRDGGVWGGGDMGGGECCVIQFSKTENIH